jgi:hypothetical protein
VKSIDYEVSGLRIRSDIPLAAERAAKGEVDVKVTAGACAEVPWCRPSSDVIAETFDCDGWPRYTFCAVEDGTTVARFYALADFTLGEDLGHVTCHRRSDVSEEMAGLLVSGNIVAYLLTIGGDYVLHASAVEICPGRAVAFVGPTMRGKTTCAALLCAEGCGLVTDDVLVVELEPPRCRRGASELRLRTQQADLISRFTRAPTVTPTPDGRLAVRPGHLGADHLALSTIVVPVPIRGGSVVKTRRLSATEGVAILLAMPRIEGWRSTAHLTRLFEQAASIAAAVPVVEVEIPWGPPFAPDVGLELIEHIGLAVSETPR